MGFLKKKYTTGTLWQKYVKINLRGANWRIIQVWSFFYKSWIALPHTYEFWASLLPGDKKVLGQNLNLALFLPSFLIARKRWSSNLVGIKLIFRILRNVYVLTWYKSSNPSQYNIYFYHFNVEQMKHFLLSSSNKK